MRNTFDGPGGRLLDTIAKLFVIPEGGQRPSARRAWSLGTMGAIVGLCGLAILLIPATPPRSVGVPFAVTGRLETYVGIALGLAFAVAMNRRRRRSETPKPVLGWAGALAYVMLAQPIGFLGAGALALYAGTIVGLCLWFVAYSGTMVALDVRALREAGPVEPAGTSDGSRHHDVVEEIDFWDRG